MKHLLVIDEYIKKTDEKGGGGKAVVDFIKVLDKFSGLLKIIGAAALTGVMLLTVIDVIGRFFKKAE